jgi:hypothetical protein
MVKNFLLSPSINPDPMQLLMFLLTLLTNPNSLLKEMGLSMLQDFMKLKNNLMIFKDFKDKKIFQINKLFKVKNK